VTELAPVPVTELAEPILTPADADVKSIQLLPADAPTEKPAAAEPPVINIVTKPTVTFSTNHVLFDSEVLEENGIEDIPFADEALPPSEEMPMEFDEEL
jgi:hypothetical protein